MAKHRATLQLVPEGSPIQIGRLALRVETDAEGVAYWRAYYAAPDTMEGAVFLGSIAMAAIIDNDPRRDQFMNIMRETVGDILEAKVGTRPRWTKPVKPKEEGP